MSWPVAANLSLLFTELPLLERIGAAADAGFDGVEIQFPYEVPPSQLSAELDRWQMPLALINVPAGDLTTGGPGLAGVPGSEAEFAAALKQALRYVRELESGRRPARINVLPGKIVANVERDVALATLVSNLRIAAEAFAELGVGVTTEAINRINMPGFLIATPKEVNQLLDAVDHANLSAQLDFFHMARMGEPLDSAISQLGERIGHVQFADSPCRGEPGSGELDFEVALRALRRQGYTGWLSAEYQPVSGTDASLGWLEAWRRAGWIKPPVRNEALRR